MAVRAESEVGQVELARLGIFGAQILGDLEILSRLEIVGQHFWLRIALRDLLSKPVVLEGEGVVLAERV